MQMINFINVIFGFDAMIDITMHTVASYFYGYNNNSCYKSSG